VQNRVCVLIITLALAGCAPHMIYLRADGQFVSDDAVIHQQFEMDQTTCSGEMTKGSLAGQAKDTIPNVGAIRTVGQGCMAERGYVLVREDQAAAKSQELAAIAAEKARREAEAATAATAAAAAAAAPPSPPKHVAVKPKPKAPQPQAAPPGSSGAS
jgi:hypothetical protein